MSNQTGIYVFCGVQTTETPDLEPIEMEGKEREIFTISHKDAAMIVAEVPMKIYHPKKENLMMHQKVINQLMPHYDAVIPISFGNVFQSVEDVEKLLESLYPQFSEIFPKIRGKVELGLKVIAKKSWLESEVEKNPSMTKKKQAMQGKSKEASYYDRIQLGEMANKFFQDLQGQMNDEIYQPLSQQADAAKLNDPISEKMLMNAAFLVDRSAEETFDELVNSIHDQWEDKVDFKYTGPWPAYNFINIRMKVEEPT
ncbi:GvpL/GvpF family gas vesicle protein [Thalassobacillus hwangdonensis]|uniref:GvpL/GvpF family gas vesicle protein n=1 Tax=Thalassobacillus hwangdonensis TaxID=546108 RepID=A0ABW3L486_9BACI